MNLKRKTELQERRIISLQNQMDKLKKENDALRNKNQELSDKVAQHQVQIGVVDEVRREFIDKIAELNVVKEQYQHAAYEARKMQKDYAKEFKPLIKRLKAQAR